MIEVLRIDDRLLHGQVAVAWTGYFQADTILIANDRVVADKTMQIAFKLAAPPEAVLSMKSLDGAVAVINNPKYESRRMMVITKNIADAVYLCERTNHVVKNVLIGGLRSGEGKKQVDLTTYLDDSDMDFLKKLDDMGLTVTAQADPTSRKKLYDDIVKAYNKE